MDIDRPTIMKAIAEYVSRTGERPHEIAGDFLSMEALAGLTSVTQYADGTCSLATVMGIIPIVVDMSVDGFVIR